MSKVRIDLTGFRHKSLKVVSCTNMKYNTVFTWNVVCNCGKATVLTPNQVRVNSTCGKCEDDERVGPELKAPKKNKRKCGLCSKPLPANRYFNHEACIRFDSDEPYLLEKYEIHV